MATNLGALSSAAAPPHRVNRKVSRSLHQCAPTTTTLRPMRAFYVTRTSSRLVGSCPAAAKGVTVTELDRGVIFFQFDGDDDSDAATKASLKAAELMYDAMGQKSAASGEPPAAAAATRISDDAKEAQENEIAEQHELKTEAKVEEVAEVEQKEAMAAAEQAAAAQQAAAAEEAAQKAEATAAAEQAAAEVKAAAEEAAAAQRAAAAEKVAAAQKAEKIAAAEEAAAAEKVAAAQAAAQKAEKIAAAEEVARKAEEEKRRMEDLADLARRTVEDLEAAADDDFFSGEELQVLEKAAADAVSRLEAAQQLNQQIRHAM